MVNPIITNYVLARNFNVVQYQPSLYNMQVLIDKNKNKNVRT